MEIATQQMEFLVWCTPIVDRMCQRCTSGCQCDAEDLRQELFAKILANPAPFTSVAPEKLTSFLRTTVRRLHIDVHRRKSELPLAEPELTLTGPDDTDPERDLDVRRAWCGLTEGERTTFFATVGEDCTSVALYQRRARVKRRLLALAGVRCRDRGRRSRRKIASNGSEIGGPGRPRSTKRDQERNDAKP